MVRLARQKAANSYRNGSNGILDFCFARNFSTSGHEIERKIEVKKTSFRVIL